MYLFKVICPMNTDAEYWCNVLLVREGHNVFSFMTVNPGSFLRSKKRLTQT